MGEKSIRLKLKVQSMQMNRVLNGLTHPAPDGLGASRMVFPSNRKTQIGPEIILLLDIMNEECEARLEMPSFMDEHLERSFTPSTEKVSFLAGIIADENSDYIPPPPPKVVCEFDLGICEKKFSFGNVIVALFGQLTFRVEGKTRMPVEGVYDGQEIGRDSEVSGVWLACSGGRQRTAAPPNHHDQHARRQAG